MSGGLYLSRLLFDPTKHDQLKYLNVGCGTVIVNSPEWMNLDINSSHEGVLDSTLSELLEGGFAGKFQAVYCSHLIEHLTRNDLLNFLSDCSQLLQSGGGIRLVTPDFDSIITNYSEELMAGNIDRSAFEKLLLLEQCVRLQPSGSYRGDIKELVKSSPSLADYISERTGDSPAGMKRYSFVGKKNKSVFARLSRARLRFSKKLRRQYLRALKVILPASLKDNVALTDAGERHQWIYSFFELELIGRNLGFAKVEKVDGYETKIFNRDHVQVLDLNSDGGLRKGTHSMYVEFYSLTGSVGTV